MSEFADRYAQSMAYGAEQYADVLDALRAAGYRAEFTQTGGMCAALVVSLPSDDYYPYVLLTDQEPTLSWDRADHVGWMAGIYTSDDSEGDPYLTSDNGDAPTAVALVAQHLGNPQA